MNIEILSGQRRRVGEKINFRSKLALVCLQKSNTSQSLEVLRFTLRKSEDFSLIRKSYI